MKTRKGQEASITKPLLQDLIARQKAEAKIALDPKPSIGSTPLPQPALYQDSGGGYNVDLEFPQD